jgi:hypothetical protein
MSILIFSHSGLAGLFALLVGLYGIMNPPRIADPFPFEGAVPQLRLTYTYKDGTFDVPVPAVVPEGFWETPQAKDWARVGDVRRAMTFTDADGMRHEIDGIGFVDNGDGLHRPLFGVVRRYRADGTLKVETTNTSPSTGRPMDWICYAADGKTPTMRISTRDHRYEKDRLDPNIAAPTYFIQSIVLCDEAGRDVAMHHVNFDGTIYVKTEVMKTENGWASTKVLEGKHNPKLAPPPPAPASD